MTAGVAMLRAPVARIVDDVPPARRRELLAWTEAHADDLPAELTWLAVAAWCDPQHSPSRRAALWHELCDRAEIARDVAGGRLDWAAADPDLRCAERTAAAMDITRQDAERALDELAGGR
jgi:hypothetical protein